MANPALFVTLNGKFFRYSDQILERCVVLDVVWCDLSDTQSTGVVHLDNVTYDNAAWESPVGGNASDSPV